MVYIPGSAGQTDHQPGFGRDSLESELIRSARDKQTPAQLFHLCIQFPTMPCMKGTEPDLGCLCVPVPKKSTLRAARAEEMLWATGIYGSCSIQQVHKRPPNSHLPNTPPKRMDTEATTLSPASWNKALSPFWEAVLRIHTYHTQPYQAFRDLPGIHYCWTQGHTGNGHTKSISDHCSLFLAVKCYLLGSVFLWETCLK